MTSKNAETQYHFISWKAESHEDVIASGSNYNYLGAPRFTNPIRKGKHKGKRKKNGRVTFLHNSVKPGDFVVIGNAPNGVAYAAVEVEGRIDQNGKSNITIAESVWPNNEYSATHKSRLLAKCDGVDVSEFKKESKTKKGPRLEFGINKGNGHKGKAGVVREISKADFDGMRKKINDSLKEAENKKEILTEVKELR